MSSTIASDHKIKALSQAKTLTDQWKNEGLTVVFTNGCFDLLHRGHIQYLSKAKSLGDKLIIGLNSDSSVRSLNKGIARPLQDQTSRASILAAMECVDIVVLFDQSTPLELIKTVQPNILVKGGDYIAEEVVGFKEVAANGGKTVILDFLPGYSTSNIERKIKESNG